jgi:hypothetical protein
MSKADEFRKEADMCERMARALSRNEAGGDYRRMATQWRQLADRMAVLEVADESDRSEPD